MAAQRPAENLLRAAGAREQRLQVDAGVDAHPVEHRHEILARDVPRRARRHRAAAELAEARLEAVDPGLQRREHVREALPARVVEVRGQLRILQIVAPQREQLADLARVGHPRGVAKADLPRARRA